MSEKNLGVISHEVLNNLNLDKNLKQINSLLKQNHRSNNLLALKAIILSKLGFNYEAEKIFEQITQNDTTKEEDIYTIWKKAAGEKAVRHSIPINIKENTLIVNVDSTAWIYQLKLKQDQILKKLTKIPTTEKIKKIRFRAGEIDKQI